MSTAEFEHEDDHDDSGTWLSISDLMSGLLMIFALLLMVALIQLSERIEEEQRSRVFIIKALTDAMQAKGIDVTINEQTGDVSILDSVLFDLGKSQIKDAGMSFLTKFIPVYSGVIFSDPTITDQVVRVVIEGHTSSEGAFAYNMNLSMDRSRSVTDFLSRLEFANKDLFLNKLMAAGRGKIDANQLTPLASDRKVLFRIQFKGDFERFIQMFNSPT